MKKGKETEFIKQAEKQEVSEFEMLNARSDENYETSVAANSLAEEIIRQAEEDAMKASMKAEEEEEKAWFKSYTLEVFSFSLIFGALSGALVWAGLVEKIAPSLWIPCSLVCLCGACLRLGAWFGRVVSK